MMRIFTVADFVAKAGGYLSLLLIVVTSLQTVADIGLRAATGYGIQGATDITQLLIMATAALAIQYAFFSDSHIKVDTLVKKTSVFGQKVSRILGHIATIVLLALIFQTGWIQAALAISYGDTTVTIAIPKAWFWYSFLAGIALSILCTLASLIRTIWISERSMKRSESA